MGTSHSANTPLPLPLQPRRRPPRRDEAAADCAQHMEPGAGPQERRADAALHPIHVPHGRLAAAARGVEPRADVLPAHCRALGAVAGTPEVRVPSGTTKALRVASYSASVALPSAAPLRRRRCLASPCCRMTSSTRSSSRCALTRGRDRVGDVGCNSRESGGPSLATCCCAASAGLRGAAGPARERRREARQPRGGDARRVGGAGAGRVPGAGRAAVCEREPGRVRGGVGRVGPHGGRALERGLPGGGWLRWEGV